MAKIQSRRTISFNAQLVGHIKAQAARDGLSLSNWVANLVRAELERRGVKPPAQWFAFDPPRLDKRTGPRVVRRFRVGETRVGGERRIRQLIAKIRRDWGMTA